MFFSEENILNIQFFVDDCHIENVERHEMLSKRLIFSKKVLRAILFKPLEWEEFCNFTMGDEFEKLMTAILNLKYLKGLKVLEDMEDRLMNMNGNIDKVFIKAFKFLSEFEFRNKGVSSSYYYHDYPELKGILGSVVENLEGLTDGFGKEIFDGNPTDMKLHILQLGVNELSKERENEFKCGIDEAEKYKKAWDDRIQVLKDESGDLQEVLKKQNEGFNFVGLNHGFKQMSDTKKSEKKWVLNSLCAMGFFLIIIPCIELVRLYYTTTVNSLDNLLFYIPAFTIEIILIYFFRVILLNYRDIKTQIIQLELRQTLCQFIQNYAEYAKKINTVNPGVLAKFENIIFSGIVSDSSKLPSIFDGLEVISKAIQSVRK